MVRELNIKIFFSFEIELLTYKYEPKNKKHE